MKERTTQVLLAAIALLLLANLFKSNEPLSPAFADGPNGVAAAISVVPQGQKAIVTNGRYVLIVDPTRTGGPIVFQQKIND